MSRISRYVSSSITKSTSADEAYVVEEGILAWAFLAGGAALWATQGGVASIRGNDRCHPVGAGQLTTNTVASSWSRPP